MTQPLAAVDPELASLIEQETVRQFKGLELIASENFTSHAVLEALGSVLTNKYAEGLPGKRYYGGNEVVDQVERLCQTRALAAFGVDASEWGVNVQPLSGSPANMAALIGVLRPHDRLMGLSLASGGHLSHGHYTPARKVSATSLFFETMPYGLDAETGLVDYDALEATALDFRPKLIIGGGSACPRDWDYARLRAICDKVNALLLVDMAHYSGLVAAGVVNNPFEFADVVTTTTHKSLRGPRSALIFFKKEHERGINNGVFPALQGGPHVHQIAATATQLREVATPEFTAYAKQVVANIRAMAARLVEHGYTLVTGGTDTHLLLWDVRPLDLSGSKVSTLCDMVSITVNKNSVVGDKSAFSPGGVRLGSPALTTRGLVEADFVAVADLLHRVVQIAQRAHAAAEGRKLTDFKAVLAAPDNEFAADIAALKKDVEAFATGFSMPGRHDTAALKALMAKYEE